MTEQSDPALGPNAPFRGRRGSRMLANTPALVVDLEALDRNIARMAATARAMGVGLRPHAKTHKCVTIARRQMAAGAQGVCCATVGEAEVLADAGIAGVLLTSPPATPARVGRIAALNRRAEGLMVVADDPGLVDALAAAAADRPLAVLVDLDVGAHRTGCPSVEDAAALAARIADRPALRFAGVQGYYGHLQHVADPAKRAAAVRAARAPLEALVTELTARGLPPAIVTGAGTGTHAIDGREGPFTEMQVGSYIFMDAQYNAVGQSPHAAGFETALFVATAVVSARHGGFVTVDGGFKAFSADGPLPVPARGAPPGSRYAFWGDEHGRLILPDGAPTTPVGTVVEWVAPHCDPTVNLHDRYHVVQGDTLIDIWPIEARGRL